MIRKWLKWLRPSSQGELALTELFNSSSVTTEAIHLEEVGLLSGQSTTIQWICTETTAKTRVSKRSKRSIKHFWHEDDRELSDFTTLISSIRKLDTIPLEDYYAPVRDGGYYYIAWGTHECIRSVTIRIPLKEVLHQRLIALIKDSVE